MNKKSFEKSKRGQITIFIIIGVIIVLAIAMIFIATRKSPEQISYKENPKAGIQQCVKNALNAAEKTVIIHGGFEKPNSYVRFNGTDVVFICYTEDNNELCINEHPLLNIEVQKELKRIIEPKIVKCFEDLKAEMINNNYKEESLNVNIVILPSQILANITKKITYNQADRIIVLEDFDTRITSPLYDFIRIENRIVNEEVDCVCGKDTCNADLISINRYNRGFEITKPAYSGKGAEIYSIKEMDSGKIFNLAVRNCVITK
jgi:hypothetical protein